MTCLHEFSLNGLPLDDELATSREGYAIRVMADDFTPSSHEAILSVVAALGADGSSVRDDRADNAETSFLVEISGPDHQALAAGEAALRRAFPRGEEQVPLVHRPCDGTSPASIRDVVHGSLEYRFDDLDESKRRIRVFEVTLTHVPYVRSENLSIVEAPYVGGEIPTTVVIDECESTAGWSATTVNTQGGVIPSLVAVSAGAVQSGADAKVVRIAWLWTYEYAIRRTGAIAMGATPYLVAEVNSAGLSAGLYVNGKPVQPMASAATDSGYIRYVYNLASYPSVSTLEWRGSATVQTTSPPPPKRIIRVRRIYRTDIPNPTSTPRQSMRTIEVGGTERSPGTIHVGQRIGTAPLGLTIVHTSPHDPGGYNPDMLRWVVAPSGPATPDPTVPAGKTYALGPGGADIITWAPSSAFPEGPYAIGAFVLSAADQTVEFVTTVAGSPPGSSDFREVRRETTLITLKAGKWTYTSLSLETLPAMRGPEGATWVTVTAPTAVNLQCGGLWAFSARDDCSLSVVEGEQPHLWIDSPTVGSAADVWVASSGDRRYGYYPSQGVTDAGLPLLSAGKVDAYVVTANADAPVVDYSHFRRWTFHAADDGSA